MHTQMPRLTIGGTPPDKGAQDMKEREQNPMRRATRIYDGPVGGRRYRAGQAGPRACRHGGAQRTLFAGAPLTRMRPRRVRRARRKRGGRALAIAALIVCLIVAIPAFRSLGTNDLGSLAGQTTGNQESPRSTPVQEWRKGEVPHLYQIDPQWANEPYAGGDMRENGCGPTCLSMVYVALTGNTNGDPVAIARMSEEQGHTVDGMTAWTLMSDGAQALGLASWEVAASADDVRAELEAGNPIICSVRPGDFTTTGHFIVLAGIADDGQVIVHDPNSAERSGRTWDLERVLSQCANLWAFSA